jgi:hypothetical protein
VLLPTAPKHPPKYAFGETLLKPQAVQLHTFPSGSVTVPPVPAQTRIGVGDGVVAPQLEAYVVPVVTKQFVLPVPQADVPQGPDPML